MSSLSEELERAQDIFHTARSRLRMPTMQGRKSETAQQIAFADKVRREPAPRV
jgi:hypothetical protein